MAYAVDRTRRSCLATLGALPLAVHGIPAAWGAEPKGVNEEVAPLEDLMREHGVLNRLLLIYEEALRRLRPGAADLDVRAVADAAGIVKAFIEDYHEKTEENHLFPRFERNRTRVELVKVLREQHDAGRKLTQRVIQLATPATLKDESQRAGLADALQQFTRMYRPHEAREDTVLFPEFHKLVSRREYEALGEQFEEEERKMFGEHGFEKTVDRVALIEERLGIADLAKFTPPI